MKKLLSLLLALVMIFSLCACTNIGNSDEDEDEEEKEEEIEYPISVEFELPDFPYTLTLEEDGEVQFSTVRFVVTAEDLDIDVESAEAKISMSLGGTYKEKKGVYTVTLDTCSYELKISAKDKGQVKAALSDYLATEIGMPLAIVADLLNKGKVDVTEQMDYPGGVVALELDGDKIEKFVVYEEDGKTVDMEYTFHSNGKAKKEIEYLDGEPYYYYEYDKKGVMIDEGTVSDDGPAIDQPIQPQPNTQPTVTPPEPSWSENTVPTEPPVEQMYYSVVIWVSDTIVDLTYEQINIFNSTNEYGIYIDAVVEGVNEGDAASEVTADIAAAPDLYCFAQDQTARLVSAGALSVLSGDYAELVWGENDMASAEAAYVGGDYWAYPMTSDNGYFMYYDKSIISDPDNLEAIIADCERNNVKVRFALDNAWYMASFFFATGCYSQWEVDGNGQFTGVFDNFNSDAGMAAVQGMQKLMNSSCYDSNADMFDDAAVVISGIWNQTAAENYFGSNLGVADLPSFTVDGWAYHLSSFHGSKLMGVKPQSDYGKEIALHLLAQYLTGEECQMDRFTYYGWGPSNVFAQMDPAVQSNPALTALYEQAIYAVPQGQIHGSWWDLAKMIVLEVQSGTSPEQALANYQASLDALFGLSSDAQKAWTVIGSVNGSNWDIDFEMVELSDGTWSTVDMLYFDVGSEFKIRQGKSWDVNYGEDGQRDGANIMMYTEGYYYVVFDPATGLTWLEG